MQPLKVASVLFRLRNYIKGIVAQVDDGTTGNSNFRYKVVAVHVLAGDGSDTMRWIDETNMPKRI